VIKRYFCNFYKITLANVTAISIMRPHWHGTASKGSSPVSQPISRSNR